jgi:hypothetical protein
MSQAFQPYFFDHKLSGLDSLRDETVPEPLETSSFHNDVSRLFGILLPKPSPFRLIRIGGNGDGAYLIPDDLRAIEACFSPGVNNIKTFEDELSLRHHVKAHMCDYSCNESDLKTPIISGFQTFQKKWLSPVANDNSITLHDWVLQSCSSSDSDLLLQMDIEGAEYGILMNLADGLLSRFRILVIEFHHLHRALYDPRVLYEVCLPTLEALSRNFTCVHVHPNNYCPHGHPIPNHSACMPEFLEVTFLRNDRFSLSSRNAFFPMMIPHPLDIANVPDNPPMFLEAEWGSGRSLRSSLKIASDKLHYSFRRLTGVVQLR